jgi:DNA-binding PadR family transcriptional regulator
MLVSSYSERIRRSEMKQIRLLQFLRDEIWTSAHIASLLFECSLSAAYKSLNQLESKGLITSFRIEKLNIKVWGISQQGQFEAWDNEVMEKRPSFQPSKINFMFVKHHLDLQISMLNAKNKGCTRWLNGKYLSKHIVQRPDAIVTWEGDVRWAVEYERTVKTRKRYEVIFSKYLQAIKAGDFSFIHYICPDELFAARLQKLFSSIISVPVAGQRITLNEKHRSKFIVSSLQNWPPSQ